MWQQFFSTINKEVKIVDSFVAKQLDTFEFTWICTLHFSQLVSKCSKICYFNFSKRYVIFLKQYEQYILKRIFLISYRISSTSGHYVNKCSLRSSLIPTHFDICLHKCCNIIHHHIQQMPRNILKQSKESLYIRWNRFKKLLINPLI